MRARRCFGRLGLILLLGLPAFALADDSGWGSSRGGPERDGYRDGAAGMDRPQVKWRERLGGVLAPGAYWLGRGDRPKVYLSIGGRLRAKNWDDADRWHTPLYALDQIIGAIDTTGDGEEDTVFAAATGTTPTLVAISRHGTAAWLASPEHLGPITGVRLVDLDGDGDLDLYATFATPGPTGAIAAAYDPTVLSGVSSWTIPAAGRDYLAGYQDVIADVDGLPGLEIVSPGHRRIYVHDAATGALLSTSAELPPIPYGRATLRPVDVDGDGDAEIAVFSNQAWAPPNNRRYVGLLDWSDANNALVFRWARDVDDVERDRVAFADESVTDLDSDGSLEVVFGVYEAARARWVLEVRDAASGGLLASLDGPRFAAVAGGTVIAADDDAPLTTYRFTRATGFDEIATGPVVEPQRCRSQDVPVATSLRTGPCVVELAGGGRGLLVAEREPGNGRRIALEVLDLGSTSLSSVGRYVPPDGVFVASVALHPQPSPASVAIALTNGRLHAVDSALDDVLPDPELPYAWPGVGFGTAFSGVDFPAFPVAVPSGAGHERILVAGGGQARLIDAFDDPSFAGGTDLAWTATGATGGVAVAEPHVVVLVDPLEGLEARDARSGEVLWRRTDLWSSDANVALHSDPLVVEGDVGRVWFHRRDNNRGALDLVALSLDDGSTELAVPDLDINNAGWRRLSLDSTGHPTSGRLVEVWRYSPETGEVVDRTAAPSGTLAIGLDPGPPASFLSVGLSNVSRHEVAREDSVWTSPHANQAGSSFRQGALLRLPEQSIFGIADATRPALRLFETDSGTQLAELLLVGGRIVAPDGVPPVPVPSLSNVTALADVTGDGEPGWLVGSSDGHVYAVAADGTHLLWSLNVEAAVGEIVPVDWDGDGLLELAVSTSDGSVLGIDRYTGDPPGWVHDVDPSRDSVEDIDVIFTDDTLHAAWEAVPGATGYQVAVFTSHGDLVSDGFVRVGNATTTSLSGLPLEDGQRYVIASRAETSFGVSPDNVSDGVTVYNSESPHGTPSGCGCGAGSQQSSTLLVTAIGWFIHRRSRRHSR